MSTPKFNFTLKKKGAKLKAPGLKVGGKRKAASISTTPATAAATATATAAATTATTAAATTGSAAGKPGAGVVTSGTGTGPQAMDGVSAKKLSRQEKLAAWRARKAGAAAAPAPAPVPAPAPAPAPQDDEVDPLESFMSQVKSEAAAQIDDKPRAVAVSMEDILAGKIPESIEPPQRKEAEKAEAEQSAMEVDEDAYYAQFKEEMRKRREEAESKAGSGGGSGSGAGSGGAGGGGERGASSVGKGGTAGDGADDDHEESQRKRRKTELGRMFVDEDEKLFDGEEWGEEKSALDVLKEKMAKKELKAVDHSKMDYAPFRKNFYIEAPELKAMPPPKIIELRNELEIKVRGKGCPAPLETWDQTGLSDKVLAIMTKYSYEKPFAIQRQALPIIMSGRDMIGVAKTGSGKTLAFFLPALRHILAQPPLADGEGPIALIMAPARELVVQIYNEARKFCKPLGLRVAAVYGGAPVVDQIAELKRGSEIVVCTPGRMIDILTLNAGRLISLARVTYVVLDEADRMFDMGFEPQISKIIGNTQPKRQTMLFSATFPKHIEGLARSVLTAPIEVVVGGRSVASAQIDQYVEVRDEDKFKRLVQLIGLWYEKGSILVFVDTQARCDTLFTELMKIGYMALSLHAGKDQFDRDQTLADFKNGVRTILIATSVAGRGLDVKDLNLVINYNAPNHLEDYVHRVGRTGRAGKRGTAFTFISRSEAQYAPDLVKALSEAKQKVPAQLEALAKEHQRQVEAGEARKRVSGYRTDGFKFDDSEASEQKKHRELLRKSYEISAGIRDVDDIMEEEEREREQKRKQLEADGAKASSTSVNIEAAKERAKKVADSMRADGGSLETKSETESTGDSVQDAVLLAAKARAAAAAAAAKMAMTPEERAKAAMAHLQQSNEAGKDKMEAARRAAAAVAARVGLGSGTPTPVGPDTKNPTRFELELEINDYPQQARYKALSRDGIGQVQEFTRAAITVKGTYLAPGRKPGPSERKLYLLIEGADEPTVNAARREMRRILEEATANINFDRGSIGKYKVV